MGILVCYSYSEHRNKHIRDLNIKWYYGRYFFRAVFLRNEPIMKVSLYDRSNRGKEIDFMEVPYFTGALVERLYEDLKLRQVSETLIHEASLFGLVEGEPASSILA
jgi:hypothetical protein